MNKKTKATKNKLTKNSKLSDKPAKTLVMPKNKGEWLKLCIKFTERAMDPHSNNDYLIRQKERLEKQLAEWKKK